MVEFGKLEGIASPGRKGKGFGRWGIFGDGIGRRLPR